MSSPPIRVFVADDEAPARRKIQRFLNTDPEVIVAGEASTGRAAVAGIERTQPDLLFLDVQMPDMDGFAVIAALEMERLPKIVFVTAYDQYALRAIEFHVFGYLLKPYDRSRFDKVFHEAKQYLEKESLSQGNARLHELLLAMQDRKRGVPRLLVQENGRGVLLELNEIDWAETSGNYLKLHLDSKIYTVRGTIESLMQNLDSSRFLRINRSCLIRVAFIQDLHVWSHGEYRVVLLSGVVHTWTRRYLDRHPELLHKL
jgi:two-component system, LytTR family, response regulator